MGLEWVQAPQYIRDFNGLRRSEDVWNDALPGLQSVANALGFGDEWSHMRVKQDVATAAVAALAATMKGHGACARIAESVSRMQAVRRGRYAAITAHSAVQDLLRDGQLEAAEFAARTASSVSGIITPVQRQRILDANSQQIIRYAARIQKLIA